MEIKRKKEKAKEVSENLCVRRKELSNQDIGEKYKTIIFFHSTDNHKTSHFHLKLIHVNNCNTLYTGFSKMLSNPNFLTLQFCPNFILTPNQTIQTHRLVKNDSNLILGQQISTQLAQELIYIKIPKFFLMKTLKASI